MKRSIGAMIGLLVLFLAAVSVANAASLNLTAPQLSTASAADRCAATVQVDVPSGMITAGSTKSVVLSGLNAECVNKDVALTLYNAQGVAVSSVPSKNIGTITEGKATVIVPEANVANVEGAALTIGTWGIPTTFTKPRPAMACTIPGHPEVACTVSYRPSPPWETGFNFDGVAISTTPAIANANWKITLNLADPAYPQTVRHLMTNMRLAPEMECESLPNIDLIGPAWAAKTDANGKVSADLGLTLGGRTQDKTDKPSTVLNCIK